jgi:hypothetical protein
LQQAPYDRPLYCDARRDIPWLWHQLPKRAKSLVLQGGDG